MKCSKGHTYRNGLTECPVCRKEASLVGNTAVITGNGNSEKTEVFSEFDNDDSNKTVVFGNERNPSKIANRKANQALSTNKTIFEDEFEEEAESGSVQVKKERRTNRRLVGWLVTYSIDSLGIDYKLYEGRNVVGQDIDCNITVNDKKISGKHAVILFRADEYMIQDQLSTHGTFVNGDDIKYNPSRIDDGDIIQMGDTIFKFRTSL